VALVLGGVMLLRFVAASFVGAQIRRTLKSRR
jgi:hypothetical protein